MFANELPVGDRDERPLCVLGGVAGVRARVLERDGVDVFQASEEGSVCWGGFVRTETSGFAGELQVVIRWETVIEVSEIDMSVSDRIMRV